MPDPGINIAAQVMAHAVRAQRFNMTHAPAGSATGGQFASGGSSSSGGKAGGAGKTAARPAPAHPPAHNAPAAGIAAKARAARKASLHARAAADRHKAHQLQIKLGGLEKQAKVAAAKSAAAAKTSKARATAAGHIAPHAVHHAAGQGKTHRKGPVKKSLKQQITEVRTQISGLLAQAKSLDAQAAKL